MFADGCSILLRIKNEGSIIPLGHYWMWLPLQAAPVAHFTGLSFWFPVANHTGLPACPQFLCLLLLSGMFFPQGRITCFVSLLILLSLCFYKTLFTLPPCHSFLLQFFSLYHLSPILILHTYLIYQIYCLYWSSLKAEECTLFVYNYPLALKTVPLAQSIYNKYQEPTSTSSI